MATGSSAIHTFLPNIMPFAPPSMAPRAASTTASSEPLFAPPRVSGDGASAGDLGHRGGVSGVLGLHGVGSEFGGHPARVCEEVGVFAILDAGTPQSGLDD